MVFSTNVFYKIFSLLLGSVFILLFFVNLIVKQTETGESITGIEQGSNAIFSKRIWTRGHLLNLTNFNFLIENKICTANKHELFAIMLITSAANHVELRVAHRQAITQKRLTELGIQRVFLLAAVPKEDHSVTQNQIHQEHQQFGDILQGSFNDAYRNLSYKHIMGLQWAATECNKARFIIKLDDDIVHDIFRIRRYLESLEKESPKLATSSELLAGVVWEHSPVLRDKNSKWYVTKEEFAPREYPSYLSGWLYITNPSTALRLVEQSKKVPMMWVDDAWVTGMLREPLGIKLTSLNSWVTFKEDHFRCCVSDLISSNLECEFYMGAVKSNASLLIEFTHNVEKCYYFECVKRKREQSLQNTCKIN